MPQFYVMDENCIICPFITHQSHTVSSVYWYSVLIPHTVTHYHTQQPEFYELHSSV